MLHLKQQVHTILEWIWGQTKPPYNMISALTIIDLADATLQTLKYLLKGLPPSPLPPNPNPNPLKKIPCVCQICTAGAVPHHRYSQLLLGSSQHQIRPVQKIIPRS